MASTDLALVDPHSITDPSSALETVSRPLLRVIQHIPGMETSFVTAIDWEAQRQDVLFSLSTGALQIVEKSQTDWRDSMCRSMFLAGQASSMDVGGDVVATGDAQAAGIKSFVAVPILAGDIAIGTVCGASRRPIELSAGQVDALQCIADAVQQLLQIELEKAHALTRAVGAEQEAQEAREMASRNAAEVERMAYLAHTDELTGLPNRRAFVARWEDMLARSGRLHYGIGVLLIDADRFKTINDTMGHQMGNEVLAAVGASLRQAVRDGDLIARLGGDEFAMAICSASGEELISRAQLIRQNFAAITAGLCVDTTLSIGIAHSKNASRHQLLAAADRALYRSKAAGGDRATLSGGVSEKPGSKCRGTSGRRQAHHSPPVNLGAQPDRK
ncbi:GGDEF domain-containing protein [Frateuria soli]|uniref:GGDEF domain-containing protein n=1 Tax=Frateuria soli TaxID=1542730 RepID=UPI001E3F9620|nr:GGDEF domain-containing protein [Frateuria soli]UGB37244.1 GGDEF domain-containing protein [Frateuria soli]